MLAEILNLSKDETPFPWQEVLLKAFLQGTVPPAVDIPTGLGKTSVMAIWLVARAYGAKLPRRLVYVVDRRAVVGFWALTGLRMASSGSQTAAPPRCWSFSP